MGISAEWHATWQALNKANTQKSIFEIKRWPITHLGLSQIWMLDSERILILIWSVYCGKSVHSNVHTWLLPNIALPKFRRIMARMGPDNPRNVFVAAVTPTAAAVSYTLQHAQFSLEANWKMWGHNKPFELHAFLISGKMSLVNSVLNEFLSGWHQISRTRPSRVPSTFLLILAISGILSDSSYICRHLYQQVSFPSYEHTSWWHESALDQERLRMGRW